MATFFVVLERQGNGKALLTCAVTGDNERWQGGSRVYDTLQDAEEALRSARVLPPVGPDQRLDAARSGIAPAFPASHDSAVALQLLHRVDPTRGDVRTFVRFQDLRGGVYGLTQEYLLQKDLEVGDQLTVRTSLGDRSVRIEKINRSETRKFGSDETRREVDVEVNF